MCRLCKQKTESIDYLVSACLILTPMEYKNSTIKWNITFIGKLVNTVEYWIIKNGINTNLNCSKKSYYSL